MPTANRTHQTPVRSESATMMSRIPVNRNMKPVIDATATNARKALADVIKAIGTDDKWGGLARRTLPKKDEITVDQESDRVGGARIEFIVEYSRRPWEA